jgi:hypothetical protein
MRNNDFDTDWDDLLITYSVNRNEGITVENVVRQRHRLDRSCQLNEKVTTLHKAG